MKLRIKRVKVLEVKSWLLLDESKGSPSDFYLQYKTRQISYLVRCNVVFNRPGFYYDRYRKFAWYEDGMGNAYTKKTLGKEFIKKLKELNKKQLTLKEREAVCTLIKGGICPDSLRDEYDLQIWSNGRRSRYEFMLRMKKEERERVIRTKRVKSPYKFLSSMSEATS